MALAPTNPIGSLPVAGPFTGNEILQLSKDGVTVVKVTLNTFATLQGTAPLPIVVESASGTTINSVSGSIVDASLAVYTLRLSSTSGMQLYKNQTVIAGAANSNIDTALYFNQSVYVKNTSAAWYLLSGGSLVLQPTGDPRSPIVIGTDPPPVVTPPPTQLTFFEDFNGTSVDWTKWNPEYAYSSAALGSPDGSAFRVDPRYAPTASINPFSLANGVLTIKTDRTPQNLLQTTNNLPFYSGLLNTRDKFSQKFGYFEIKCKTSNVFGVTCQFWLVPADGTWPPEIDVFEVIGKLPGAINVNAFWGPATSPNTRDQHYYTSDLSTQFHTYGLNWQDDYITYYFDGIQIAQLATPAEIKVPMFMIVSMSTGLAGSWQDYPPDNAPFPATYQIDYVSVQQTKPATTVVPGLPESAEGASVTTVGPVIKDAAGNTYGINSAGYIVQNGTADTVTSANVVQLYYHDHQLYQQNSAGNWYTRPSITGQYTQVASPIPASNPPLNSTPGTVESPDGTKLTTAGGTITDANLDKWTLVTATLGGLGIAKNGTYISPTANVAELFIYNHKITQKNSAGSFYTWNGTAFDPVASDPRTTPIPTGPVTNYPAAAGPGPTVTGGLATIDFGAPTGFFANRYMWGIAAAAPNDNHFALCADSNFLSAMEQIQPALYRINSNSGGNTGYWSDEIFAGGVNNPNWSVINNFIQNGYRFISDSCRLIIGVRFINHSTSDYATMMQQMVNKFRNTNGGNGKPLNVWGWEVDNEQNGHVDDPTYCSYFNAAADAIHAIDANIAVLGTVDDSIYPGRATYFANACGTRAAAYDFHDYMYLPGVDYTNSPNAQPTDAEAFASNRSATVVTSARNALNGTPMAGKPLFIGEWNMEAFPTNKEKRMQQAFAVPWSAKYMAQAFKAHVGFEMGGLWEAAYDTDYGIFQGSSTTLSPAGRFLGKAGKVMHGNEVGSTFSGGNRMCLPIANGNHIGVMLINWSTAPISGTVALSRWPINTTGTATITKWEGGSANPQGVDTQLTVTNGVTPSITVPGYSVVILHN